MPCSSGCCVPKEESPSVIPLQSGITTSPEDNSSVDHEETSPGNCDAEEENICIDQNGPNPDAQGDLDSLRPGHEAPPEIHKSVDCSGNANDREEWHPDTKALEPTISAPGSCGGEKTLPRPSPAAGGCGADNNYSEVLSALKTVKSKEASCCGTDAKGNGCCSPNTAPNSPRSCCGSDLPTGSSVKDECCQPKTTCGSKKSIDEEGRCRTDFEGNGRWSSAASLKPAVPEAGGCCNSKKSPKPGSTREKCSNAESSCGAQGITEKKGRCTTVSEGDACCSTTFTSKQTSSSRLPKDIDAQSTPSCCQGKPSPCCDSTCIERLALRECEGSTKSSCRSTDSISECGHGIGGKPCSYHSRTAREQYQERLATLGCLCRMLLALGQESCCMPKMQTPPRRKSQTEVRSTTSPLAASCCVPITGGAGCLEECSPRSKRAGISPCPEAEKDGCNSDCCSNPALPLAQTSVCIDDRCDDRMGDPLEGRKKPTANAREITDLEKGASAKDQVMLSISGMTCTGCETKLQRTLSTIPAVTNLKSSLVLARAQFDLDTDTLSAEDVIKHIERTTEFKCQRISNRGSSLELVCDGSPADLVNGKWPLGVVEIRSTTKTSVQVDFDENIIGARDLIEKGWDAPMRLAPPQPDSSLQTGSKHVRRVGYMTLLSALLTIPVLVLAWAPLPERPIEYGSASLALATIVQLLIAGPFYPKALKALIFSRVVEMDLLIVLSTSTAYIFSVVSFGYLISGRPLSTGEFFETSTLLVTLIMVGRYVAALARQKAVESISIRSLQTSTAIIVDDSGTEKEIDARLLQYGDKFKVLPECRIPTDGTVLSGSSEVNESMMTGESRPVEKYVGDTVIAGSVNGSGLLYVRLTQLPSENTISTIARMVDEAKLSKPQIQNIADRVASYFVPVILALTIITFVTWVGVGVSIRQNSGSEAVIQAITYAITVIIVSCPCAIGLAVPMVIVIATGIAADHGVIFKAAESIEEAHRTTDVVFDKTGTLTEGDLTVAVEEYCEDDRSPDETKKLLLGLVDNNKHPVSVAVADHLKASGITSNTTIRDPRNLTGKGIEATTISGDVLRAGNSRWLTLSTHPTVQAVNSQGMTAFLFTINGRMSAVFGLQDTLRPDAVSTVRKLQTLGITTHILSGDDDAAVQSVASQVGIPSANTRSRCTPQDKRAYITTLLARTPEEKKKSTVLFLGDGTNDAPALAQASIGIHIPSSRSSSGTDIAQSAADVVLVRPRLAGVLTAIAISKLSIRRIAFNFAWSFVYNLFAILLAAGAFTQLGNDARIPPEFAGLGELVSVLPVLAVAVGMRWARV